MLAYPVRVRKTRTPRSYRVTSRYFRGLETTADDMKVALDDFKAAILKALAERIAARKTLPVASHTGSLQPGEVHLLMPALVDYKVVLYNAWHKSELTEQELCKKARMHASSVAKLFNLTADVDLHTVEKLVNALGMKLSLTLVSVSASETP